MAFEKRYLGVPYNFKRPTMARMQESYWNAQTTRILTPAAFGVGWGLNLYPLSVMALRGFKAMPNLRELAHQVDLSKVRAQIKLPELKVPANLKPMAEMLIARVPFLKKIAA